jgi:hypothetical protein
MSLVLSLVVTDEPEQLHNILSCDLSSNQPSGILLSNILPSCIDHKSRESPVRLAHFHNTSNCRKILRRCQAGTPMPRQEHAVLESCNAPNIWQS